MIPLIWKEWQEAKRPFAGGLITLALLPLIMIVIYRFGFEKEWLFGTGTLLTAFFGPLIAATWGAHVICHDLASPRGRFLYAQPVRPAKVIAIKLAVATLLVLGLIVIACSIDLLGWRLTHHGDSNEIFPGSAAAVSYLFGIIATLAAASLTAIIFKKLVPALLVALAAAAVLLVAPMIWAGALLGPQRGWESFLGATVAAAGAVPLLFGAVWAGRRPERSPLSLKPLAWGGAALFLVATASITRTLGNNTSITYQTGAWGFQYYGVWSIGDSLSWLSNGFHLLTLGDDGIPLGRDRVTAAVLDAELVIGRVQPYSNGLDILLESQPRRVEERKSKLVRLPLFGPDAGKLRVLLNSGPLNGWVSTDDRLVRMGVQFERGPVGHMVALTLDIFSLDDSEPRPTGSLQLSPPIFSVWSPQMSVDGNVLTIWQRETIAGMGGSIVQRIDISDPSAPKLLLTSDLYPTPSTVQSRIAGPDVVWMADFHQGKLALTSRWGLWLYELTADGHWRLLGQRPASIIELLAGRDLPQLIWKGDRIYEASGTFGLLVYDVSDPARPRRIAHSGTPIQQFTVLDNGLVAASTNYQTIEVHKLPGT